MSPASSSTHSVWYIAAGYSLPAGVEAYLLQYATELRRHGFDTRILVFQPLPKIRHRYLQALDERGIPIESLYAACALRARILTVLLGLPWALYLLAVKRQRPRLGWFHAWWCKRLAVARLARLIRREKPDILHVKARLLTEAWPVFPPERTIYQHALSGTVDPSWTPVEVEAFRQFANRIARIFVQGRNIAEVMRREFRLTTPMDVIFTMAPDEVGPQGVTYFAAPVVDPVRLRFGILCRFTEQKGIPQILEALRIYRDRFGDVDFTFAGLGPLEATIRDFAGKHGLARVRIVRVTTPAAVLRDLDVFVHPGLDDAMPVSIVEAFMCGRPCLGTCVGGVPDLVRDGVEGLLVEPGSAEAIAGAMSRFACLSAGELAGFQQRARARYEEKCRPAEVAALVAEKYREILRQAGPARQEATA